MTPNTTDFLMVAALLLSIIAVVKILSDHFTTRKLMGAHLSDAALRDLLRWTKDVSRQGAFKWGLVWGTIGLALIIVDLSPLQLESPAGVGAVVLAASAGMLAYYLLSPRDKGDA